MTSMLCSMKRTNPILQNLDFVMLFCGFKSRITKHDKFYTEPISDVKSLHVYGEADVVIPLEMSEKLVTFFDNPTTMKHPGGWFSPRFDVFSF